MSFLIQQLAANGGTGSPSTLGRIVASKAIFDFITNDSISAISVNVAGSGYVVGETFSIVLAGSPGTEIFQATGIVTEVSDSQSPQLSPLGQVTGVKILSGGAYTDAKQSPEIQLTNHSTANSSAGGDDQLTVDVVFEEAHWAEDRGNGAESPLAATDYVNDSTDFEWICSSLKASNPPTIGLETATDGDAYVNIMVATGYNGGATFTGQPGTSPNGPKLMMPSNDPQIYISSTERRVNILIRDGNFVQYGTIGFFIPFTDTEANYPFPGACFGQTQGTLAFSSSMVRGNGSTPATQNSGVVNAMALQTGTAQQTPYFFRDNLSPQWLTICESTAELTTLRAQIWPQQQTEANYDFTYAPEVDGMGTQPITDQPSNANTILRDGAGWFQTAAGGVNGIQGVGPIGLGNRLSFVVQPHIIANQTGDVQAVGIIDGYQAVHGRGLTAFEEIVQSGGKRFIAFPDTNTGDIWRWVAMEIL